MVTGCLHPRPLVPSPQVSLICLYGVPRLPLQARLQRHSRALGGSRAEEGARGASEGTAEGQLAREVAWCRGKNSGCEIGEAWFLILPLPPSLGLWHETKGLRVSAASSEVCMDQAHGLPYHNPERFQ